MPNDWGQIQIAAHDDQLVVDLDDLAGIQKILESSGVSWERIEKCRPLGLALIRLGDPGNIPARYKDPDAASELDRLISYLKRSYEASHSGQTPVIGKNRLTGSIEGSPYTGGDQGDPQWYGALGGFPKRTDSSGPQVKVGILDTRLFAHPDLAGRYFADYDTLAPATSASTPTSLAHATFIAGVVLARAPNASLVAGHVLKGRNMCGSSWEVATKMAGLADAGVSVANISFGAATYDDEPPLVLSRGVEKLTERGIVVVAAAGNHGSQEKKIWPAALDNVVAVGAATRIPGTDEFETAAFSPRQPWVDLLAPGEGVQSLYKTAGYATWDGTSFSAAAVSGAIAQLAQTQHMAPAQGVEMLRTPPKARPESMANTPIDDIGSASLATKVRSRGALPGPYSRGALPGPYTGGAGVGPYTGGGTAGPYVGGGSGGSSAGGGGRGGGTSHTGDGGAKGDPTSESLVVPEPPLRHLIAELPERAPVGRRISLLVRIALAAETGSRSAALRLDVPAEGRDVTITVSAPGLVPTGDLEQELHVPAAADSQAVRFGFKTGRAGLHSVVVRAFAGGTMLCELALEISVEVSANLEEGTESKAVMDTLAAEPGEVTLQVTRTEDDQYSFQLMAEAWYPVELTKRLAGDPTEVVKALAGELREMAGGQSRFTTSALVRNRIRQLGAQLWAGAVPKAVRDQFWAQAGRIKLFTVASDMDTVPWELLYPVDGDNDNGFLVEQFPVIRRAYGQGRVRQLPLTSAAFVVPPGSPSNAMTEVTAVRSRLGNRVHDQGVIDQLGSLITLLEGPPSVLHFACHNQFTEQTGSVINLTGGPWRPDDLAVAVQTHRLAAASPLVFFNACRTAGEIPGLLQMIGWAKQFMGAGAGAFVGSLWAVRSSSAQAFADAFYQALVTEGAPLGAASLQARQAIARDDGDPTWLAYTVYGNPSATVEGGAET